MKLKRGSVALATALALLCAAKAEARYTGSADGLRSSHRGESWSLGLQNGQGQPPSSSNQRTVTYQYDGRWVSQSVEKEGALTQIVDQETATPTVVATFVVDASGRVRNETWSEPTLEQTFFGATGAGTRQLNWDTSGRLVSVQPTDGNPALSFTYDANGQRQSRAAGPGVSPATYVWGGGELWSEGLQDGTLVHYDRLGDIALAGASQQLMHDPLNSVVGLVGTFTPGSSSSSSGSTGTTSGSSGTTSGTTGTTGTTGGTTGTTGSGVVAAVCGPCESNNECVTGYCERSVGFCEPAGPCSDDSQCFGERCDTATGNCLCGSMQAGTGGTTGSGAGTEALCTTCAENSDCESGYCDRELSQCQPAAACATTSDCGGLACNTATGECTCGPTTQVQGLAGRGRAQDSSMQASGTPALQLYRYGAYGGEWLQGGYTAPQLGGQSLSYAGGFDDPYLADSHTLGWRTAQPSTGLFSSQDPLGPDGDPLMSGTGINAFLYANANPLRYTDPRGTDGEVPSDLFSFWGDIGASSRSQQQRVAPIVAGNQAQVEAIESEGLTKSVPVMQATTAIAGTAAVGAVAWPLIPLAWDSGAIGATGSFLYEGSGIGTAYRTVRTVGTAAALGWQSSWRLYTGGTALWAAWRSGAVNTIVEVGPELSARGEEILQFFSPSGTEFAGRNISLSPEQQYLAAGQARALESTASHVRVNDFALDATAGESFNWMGEITHAEGAAARESASEVASSVAQYLRLKGQYRAQSYLGPYYEAAVQLHGRSPAFFPEPDTTPWSTPNRIEREAAREMFEASGLSGHHLHPIAHGGPAIPSPGGLTFTGESTIRASDLAGLDLGFYSPAYGKQGAERLKIYQTVPGGLYVFGANPQHTEATTFFNQVFAWQKSQGIR